MANLRSVRDRLREWLPALLGLTIFVAALEMLRVEARSVSWAVLMRDVASIPRTHLALALVLTTANYAVLAGYDLLAFVSVGRQLPRRRRQMTR